MSFLVGWLVLLCVTVATLWHGLRFRAGRPGIALSLYRNPTLPRAIRNWFLVAPISMSALICLLLGFLVVLVEMPFGIEIPRRLLSVWGFALTSLLMLFVAVTAMLLFRPPASLTPRWLADDDRRVGFRPPSPHGADWLTLAFLVVPAGLIAVAALFLAIESAGGA